MLVSNISENHLMNDHKILTRSPKDIILVSMMVTLLALIFKLNISFTCTSSRLLRNTSKLDLFLMMDYSFMVEKCLKS